MKASPHYYESDLQQYYTYARSILHVLKQNKADRLVFTQWQTHIPVTVHLRTCWSEKAHWTRTGNYFFHAELHSSPLSPSTPSSSYHSIPSFHIVFSYVTTVEVAPLSYRWHCFAYTAATWVRTLKLYVTTAIALELRVHTGPIIHRLLSNAWLNFDYKIYRLNNWHAHVLFLHMKTNYVKILNLYNSNTCTKARDKYVHSPILLSGGTVLCKWGHYNIDSGLNPTEINCCHCPFLLKLLPNLCAGRHKNVISSTKPVICKKS